ncbi:hypothetical protein PF003_g38614 [Phytophthora fragariae]|nr:hypothetical protein PF003_g40003 [Phytophthora fragariae]KAE8877274.1 hypothetical protein PF003_g38614 [Phytophthora fragariae]
MDAPQLTRRKPKALPRLLIEPEDEDEAFATVPVEQLCDTHLAAQWALLLAVPATSAAAWFPISISRAPRSVLRITSSLPPPSPDSPTPSSSLLAKLARRYRRNHMFAVYQSVGWTLYVLFVALQLICFGSDSVRDLPFSRPGSRSVQAVAAFIAEVLIISSVLTLEKRRDRNRQRRKDRFVVQLNNFNNMLLLVGATLLALASEYTRMFPHPSGSSVGYPMATGLGSLALFVTALFNTYGLGGVLSTKDGWNFYQPFMGGARFVLFQIVSWTCFGAGAALQVLYLLSLVVVELELFVGAMAVAGSLFVVAEIGMMMSLLVFKKAGQSPKRAEGFGRAGSESVTETKKTAEDEATTSGEVASVSSVHAHILDFHERLRDFADECLAVLVIGGLANIQFIPNALMLVFFALATNLSPAGVVFYGMMATGMEFIMVISRSIATHLYLKDSHNGLRKEVNRYHVKYVLPQIVTGCLPAVATYRHYIYDMEAFIPVLLLTIFVFIYEFTYRGNPQQTGCRERSSWVTGRSILIDTVKRYFSGTIIRMAPLDPEKHFKEGEMMDNVQAPMLQRWFVKKLAFPFPYFPYGRALLPIPRKINIPVVVGEPLEVPHIEKPTQEDIDEVHVKYFAALQEMFDKYKDEVGCGDYKLVLI